MIWVGPHAKRTRIYMYLDINRVHIQRRPRRTHDLGKSAPYVLNRYSRIPVALPQEDG